MGVMYLCIGIQRGMYTCIYIYKHTNLSIKQNSKKSENNFTE